MSGNKKVSYLSLMRQNGLRVTAQRRLILELLELGPSHPDATAIHREAQERDPHISLATVYRTMKALEDLGAIQRHVFEGGPARFENTDTAHHDHLIDLDTGAVIEFSSSRIEELQKKIADELGYEIVHHRLELYGRRKR